MSFVIEMSVVRQFVNSYPLNWLSFFIWLFNLLNPWTICSDYRVAVHTSWKTWYSCMIGFIGWGMAIATLNFKSSRMQLMAEGNWLFRLITLIWCPRQYLPSGDQKPRNYDYSEKRKFAQTCVHAWSLHLQLSFSTTWNAIRLLDYRFSGNDDLMTNQNPWLSYTKLKWSWLFFDAVFTAQNYLFPFPTAETVDQQGCVVSFLHCIPYRLEPDCF